MRRGVGQRYALQFAKCNVKIGPFIAKQLFDMPRRGQIKRARLIKNRSSFFATRELFMAGLVPKCGFECRHQFLRLCYCELALLHSIVASCASVAAS